MKKILIIPIILIILSSCSTGKYIEKFDYDAQSAVDYALKHAKERNLDYPEYDKNCTNFVSQCLVAGGMTMNEGPPPDEKSRIKHVDDKDKWYCYSSQFAENKPPNHSLSLPFVNTMAFIEYWVDYRGAMLNKYSNTFDGRDELLLTVEKGDVFLLYDENGDAVHIGLITDVKSNDAFFCANTIDHFELSVCNINSAVYPELGILSVSRKK